MELVRVPYQMCPCFVWQKCVEVRQKSAELQQRLDDALAHAEQASALAARYLRTIRSMEADGQEQVQVDPSVHVYVATIFFCSNIIRRLIPAERAC